MKILIATDGSEFSRAAIEQACRLANEHQQAEIKVISVYELHHPIGTEPFAVSAEYLAEMNDLGKQRAENWAREAADLIGNSCNASTITVSSVVKQGTPAMCIVDTAASWDADLIVMGSHGRGFWGRMTLGSVSDAVVHHAPCSVLIAKVEKTASAAGSSG